MSGSSRRQAHFQWSARRWVLSVLGGVVALLVVAGGIFAYQVAQARSALVSAESRAQTLQTRLTANDQNGAQSALDQLQLATKKAKSSTNGVLWSVASHVPVFGDDVSTVRTVARVLDDVSTTGIQPLVDATGKVDANAFTPRNGRVDLAGIVAVRPALADASKSLTAGKRDLAAIDTHALVGQLRGPVEKLRAKIDSAQRTASAGEKAARLLPAMLGQGSKRSYILAFQNNAEIRSTGGLPGAYAILEADNGRLSITDQGTAAKLGYFEPPVVKLKSDERNLYSNLMASFFADTTFTPDFPRAAGIMRAMVKERTDVEADGIISVDPVALSYLLRGTGPLTLEDGTKLTSENAVRVLLNDVYKKYADSPEKQDAYFADAARRVFSAVTSGKGDPTTVLRSMSDAVRENRILVASADRKEQALLESTRIAGALPEDSGSTPHVGLYLNDSTETKLEYYLRRKTTVASTGCTRQGVQQLELTTVLTSTAPPDAASLPESILGPGTGEKRGSMRMNLRYYAPYGGHVEELTVNGAPVTVNLGDHKGREVAILPVLLAPGQKTTVEASITSGASQRKAAVFSTTPGIEPTPNNVAVPSACVE